MLKIALNCRKRRRSQKILHESRQLRAEGICYKTKSHEHLRFPCGVAEETAIFLRAVEGKMQKTKSHIRIATHA